MQDKILLIFDLDETLIHSTSTLIREDFNFKIYQYFVYKRPFLDEFLAFCAENFTLAVWSSGSDDYVEEIVKMIFPENIKLAFAWGRSRCTPIISLQIDQYGDYNLDVNNYYEYAKKLKKIKKKGYKLEKTLIIDDTPAKLLSNYGNAIYSKEYKGETNDVELQLLTKYLLTLYDAENVRTIEKRFWRRQFDQK